MRCVLLFVAWLVSLPVVGQRLLWEQAQQPYGYASKTWWVVPLPNQQFLLDAYLDKRQNVGTCRYNQFAFQVHDLTTGSLVHEQLSRTMYSDFSSVARQGSRVWWSGLTASCVNQQGSYRPLGYRLTSQGDTVNELPLAGSPTELLPQGLFVRGRRLARTGYLRDNSGSNRLEVALTVADTSGQMLSYHTYPRPLSNDYCSDVVGTPRGGYLLNGDGQVQAGFKHLLIETDSLGNLLRQRLIEPLGPDFASGGRLNGMCNVAVLPNAGGYLLSGRADSAAGTAGVRRVAYLMRVDTALNVQWVYRHPTATNGNGNRSQACFKVRLLPDGTAALFVADMRSPYTNYLVHVDAAGRHRGTYPLVSTAQQSFSAVDWQWLGDGTLLLGGTASSYTVAGQHSYAARWDFRGTPLAVGNIVTAATVPYTPAGLGFSAAPVPAQDKVQLYCAGGWPVGARIEILALATGQLLQRLPVPGSGSKELAIAIAGWTPGVYAARLLNTDGQLLGTAKVVVVR